MPNTDTLLFNADAKFLMFPLKFWMLLL
jgi:hypothetical protein